MPRRDRGQLVLGGVGGHVGDAVEVGVDIDGDEHCPCRRAAEVSVVSMNSWETIGQMSVQCGSMNSSTTARPRKLANLRTCPAWPVRVNPGAGRAGTGEGTAASGRPAGWKRWRGSRW